MSDARDANDILHALDLPQEALAPLLEHIASFCHQHGGERHYAELLAMVERMRAGL